MPAATPPSSAPTTCCPATCLLRMVDEAVGGAGAGPQLQRHGQPARRAQPLPLRRPARRLRPPRQCDAPARRRCRTARLASRCAHGALISISTTRAFRSRADCCSGAAAPRATTRWCGVMRARADQRGVDIVQNCEVTGIRVEGGRVDRRRDDARLDTRRQGRRWRCAGNTSRVAAHGRPAAADREPRAAGLRVRGHQAADRPASSPSAPATSTSASPTRAGWCSAATSTATIPTPSAAICRRSRTSARAAWR